MVARLRDCADGVASPSGERRESTSISELSVFPMACSIPLQENRKDFIMINKRFKGCWRLIGRGMMQLMAFLLWLSKFLRILDRCLSAGRKVIDQYRSFFNDWFS
jgi:hypothetical protein